MTIQDIDKNIKEFEKRLISASGRQEMVLRNCITTMRMKRKELVRSGYNEKHNG